MIGSFDAYGHRRHGSLAVLALALIVVGGYLYRQSGTPTPSVQTLATDAGCDLLAGPCLATADGVTLELRIGPGVVPLQRFPVQAKIDGMDVDVATVSFSMKGMDMGRNDFELREVDGLWKGWATLPVCWQGRRDWLVRIKVRRGEQLAEALFTIGLEV